MAWPKGRKRAKVEKQAKAELESAVPVEKPRDGMADRIALERDIDGPRVVDIYAYDGPAPVEEPPKEPTRAELNRAMMLDYIRGNYIHPDRALHWDMRGAPIVKRVRLAMAKDRATPDQAEAYLDAELARR